MLNTGHWTLLLQVFGSAKLYDMIVELRKDLEVVKKGMMAAECQLQA
jgi:hypothetical protein